MTDDAYTLAPAVLLVTADEGVRGRRAIETAGGRVRAVTPLADAVAWLDEQAPVDVVVADLDAATDGEALARLAEWLRRAGARLGTVGVVAVPTALVDRLAAALLDDDRLFVLADADAADLTASVVLALAQARTEPTLRDRDGEPGRLRQLSEEVGRIARTLAELSSVQEPRDSFRGGPPAPPPSVEPGPEISAGLIRSAIRGRRLRDQFFDSQLFADPAWDMLLDLMAARLEGRQVAVSSLCIAAAVPATTALRWIKTLVDEGMFVRVADPRDGRRVFIELSEPAAKSVRAYFNALAKAGVGPA